jgi:hypothetical protein
MEIRCAHPRSREEMTNQELSDYFRMIGERGDRAKKGTEAAARSASKAASHRWTITALREEPDLIDRVMREGFALAWARLNRKQAALCLVEAFQTNLGVQAELAKRKEAKRRALEMKMREVFASAVKRSLAH